MVQVTINKESFALPNTGTLADVLSLLDIQLPDGIAIAVNDNVIPKGEWLRYKLQADDNVFVIRATQGG
jgi:sulfur carrier protein